MRFGYLLHTVYVRTEGSDEPVQMCNLYVQSICAVLLKP